MNVSIIYDVNGWSWHHIAQGIQDFHGTGHNVKAMLCDEARANLPKFDALLVLPWVFGRLATKPIATTHLAHFGALHNKDDENLTEWESSELVSQIRNRTESKAKVSKFDRIIAANPELEALGTIYKKEIKYIPSGTDTQVFQPKRKRTYNGKLKIGWLGQLPAHDGPADVKGYRQVAKPLGEKLKSEGIADVDFQIRDWRTAMPTNELIQWYNSIDILLTTSMLEGASLSPLEAMACGCVVVGTSMPDLEPLIHNELNGYISTRWCDPVTAQISVDQLFAYIRHLHVNQNLLIELSARAHQSIVKYRDWRVLAPQWIDYVTKPR